MVLTLPSILLEHEDGGQIMAMARYVSDYGRSKPAAVWRLREQVST